jgi:ABC-2 type transport system ATP-binding protein
MAIIETVELSKVYGSLLPGRSHVALDRLTMLVPERGIFGFLGPNGAGKTTTLKLLLGLTSPSSGTGRVLGQELGEPEVRRKIGYLAENPGFYDYLRADEFLDYCGRFFRIGRRERRARVDELLDYVGLKGHGSEKLKSFSKGMLQRVGLAQALINDPELLLLDEPMGGLDPIGRKQFKDLIRKACREDGKTVFFCSHVLAEVEEVCDHVAILADGRLLTQDRIDKLQLLKEITLTVDAAGKDLLDALRAEGCTVRREDNRLLVSAAGEVQAERAGQLVEEHGARCLEKRTETETLEEFFVRAVSQASREPANA